MRILFLLCSLLLGASAFADDRTIDISGDNTSSSYVTYSQYIYLPQSDTVNVKMARYVYFSSRITGSGVLNLHAGGERCYLGTEKGKAWPDWTGYTGDVHIWPFAENSSSAGFYGVVLAHGGKSFSPESIEEGIRTGKVNPSMQNNRVVLHEGATICCEANTSGAGFRIGELQTEAGSTLQGYMKNSRAAYYLLGCMNTDATLAGKIAPSGYRDDTPLGIIKEGTGTYSITGNDNYLSGALRILEGRVLVMNDREATESQKLRGALGARPNASEAIAYVFADGILGGTGSIGGTVDNYGTITPGGEQPGVLTLKNYAAEKEAHLFVRPTSVLKFRIASADSLSSSSAHVRGTEPLSCLCHDQLTVDGEVKYINTLQDFTTSDKMPVIRVDISEDAPIAVGDEFAVLNARRKTSQADEWHFDVKANKYTWEIIEREENGSLVFVLRVISLEDMDDDDDPGDHDNPDSTMGAYYNDGVDDASDPNTLRYYAEKNGKSIGTAISMWKNDLSNANLSETKEVGAQFNMLVAENEMKFDALEPSRNSFNYGSADQLVGFAQQHQMTVRGHCLAWHSQLPTWVSSDGKKNDMHWSREEALQILRNHIENVVTHFKGKVTEWDVVNECLDDDQSIVRTEPDGYKLRQSVWTLAIGEDFIDSAFVYAHRADPDAILYLNEYGVEMQGKAKAIAFHNLVDRLKRSGIPIDGVGLQCHFSLGDVDSLKLSNNIRGFAEKGMKCIITELDIGVPSPTDENLEEQARNYRVVTDIMLNHDNCPHMVIWGLKDNNSWRETSNPLLYTAQLSRKPAWYAVRSALRHRVITDIHTVVREIPDTDITYDLMGRQMGSGPLLPGIYIRSGKKFVVK